MLGEFLLPAVPDHLPEQAVVVADAVAAGRDAEARHALHQAGGKAAETAIAERGVGLGAAHPVEVDAEIAERGGDGSVSRRLSTTSSNSRPIRNSSDR